MRLKALIKMRHTLSLSLPLSFVRSLSLSVSSAVSLLHLVTGNRKYSTAWNRNWRAQHATANVDNHRSHSSRQPQSESDLPWSGQHTVVQIRTTPFVGCIIVRPVKVKVYHSIHVREPNPITSFSRCWMLARVVRPNNSKQCYSCIICVFLLSN